MDDDNYINTITCDNSTKKIDIETKRTYFIQKRLYEIEFDTLLFPTRCDSRYKFDTAYEMITNEGLALLNDNEESVITHFYEMIEPYRQIKGNQTTNDTGSNNDEYLQNFKDLQNSVSEFLISHGDIGNYGGLDEYNTFVTICENIQDKYDIYFNELFNARQPPTCTNTNLRLNREILTIQRQFFGIEFGKYVKPPENSNPPSVSGNTTLSVVTNLFEYFCGLTPITVHDPGHNPTAEDSVITITTYGNYATSYEGKGPVIRRLITNSENMYIIRKIYPGEAVEEIDGYKIAAYTYNANRKHSLSRICYQIHTTLGDKCKTIDDARSSDSIPTLGANIMEVELVLYENTNLYNSIKLDHNLDFLHGGSNKYKFKSKLLKYIKKIENFNT